MPDGPETYDPGTHDPEVSDGSQTFGFGRGEVVLDRGVHSVVHPARPGLNFLGADLAPIAVVIGGRRHGCRPAGGTTDADEVEIRYRVVGRDDVEIVVRHAFRTVWVQRYTVINRGAEPLLLDDLHVGLAPGPATVGWAMTAGAEAFWLTQPADGAGPVLATTLQFGDVCGYDPGAGPGEPGESGWRTGPLVLGARARYVLQWQTDWFPTVADFDRRRASLLPDRTELTWPDPCALAGTDTAVVAGPGLTVGQEGEQTVIEPQRPGLFDVELRSARGTFRLGLTWSQPLGTWVSRAARGWVEGDRTPAGIARLPGSAAGIVVQQALADRLLDHADAAVEALDRLAAQLLDRPRLSAFDIALLAGESIRTGDRDFAAAARRALLAATVAEPGLGLAATRVSLAELAAGGSIGPILGHLTTLADPAVPAVPGGPVVPADPGGPVVPADPGGPVGTGGPASPADVRAAQLELGLIIRPQGSALSATLLAQALALGAAVGAGLPGHSMLSSTTAELAYAAALLGLVPEGGVELDRRWTLGPQALAERLRWRSLAGFTAGGEQAGPPENAARTLGWLVLSQPTA